jgi:hypothetical protein
VVSVSVVAEKFSLEDAKVLACWRLCHAVDVNNVVDIYCNAVNQVPRLLDVEKTCLNFIARNLQQVSKTTSFCDLPQDLMLRLVQEAAAMLSL